LISNKILSIRYKLERTNERIKITISGEVSNFDNPEALGIILFSLSLFYNDISLPISIGAMRLSDLGFKHVLSLS
jgi:Zn-dependent membrane protease YugP